MEQKTPESPTCIGVFAKHWTPGRTKTRLARSIGERPAADAARLFLKATLARLGTLKGSRRLGYTPGEQRSAFESLVADLGAEWQLSAQPSGTLGERMRWYFDSAFASGARVAIYLSFFSCLLR